MEKSYKEKLHYSLIFISRFNLSNEGRIQTITKVDSQKSPELVIDVIKALQDYEIEEYERLDAIRRALQTGKAVKKDNIKFELLHLNQSFFWRLKGDMALFR